MNVISLSLYGTDPRYTVGAIENAKMARIRYPGCQVHMWCRDAPTQTMIDLSTLGVHIHAIPPWCVNGMFSRFLAHDLPGVTRYVVRDVDSRFTSREDRAVNAWVKAGTKLHSMRDHPWHNQPMAGGMWGWKRDQNDFVMDNPTFREWAAKDRYGYDQDFLRLHVWTKTESKTVHDSCGTFDGTVNWAPDKDEPESFVGEYVDVLGRPNWRHRKLRWKHLKNIGVVK